MIAIIVIVAAVELIPRSKAPSSVSVSASSGSSISTVGNSVAYYAFVKGGTPSSVTFNFGDGGTGVASLLSGNEYTAAHAYSSAGRYLVTVNATFNGRTANNSAAILEENILPASSTPPLAFELTQPTVITQNQTIAAGSSINLTGAILQPPTATSWVAGYYVWSFGAGSPITNYALLNTSSSGIMPNSVSRKYTSPGIYVAKLVVVTFNATGVTQTNYTSNGVVYDYYPVSELSSILSSSSKFQNNTYEVTIVVGAPGQALSLATSSIPSTNKNQISVVEVAPGGPITLDPALEYYTVSYETDYNVYQSLIQYNGSSTSQYVPVIASKIPTVANGLVSSNGLNYTFPIRQGLKFSNGAPLTTWDVYTSFVRDLLFTNGAPGDGDWIIATDLLPAGGYAANFWNNATAIYDNITHAVTYSNTTNTVTFHLLQTDPAFLNEVLLVLVTNYNWLAAHGAGFSFTPQGFLQYTSYGNLANYNSYIQYNMMGSGPFMTQSFVIGQSIVLKPNPNFTPIPGYPGYDHMANETLYIQWEKDPSTALLLAKTGQSDITQGLPTSDYPTMASAAANGVVSITSFSTLEIWFYGFNWYVNTSMMTSQYSGTSIPKDYFANPLVREAFAYAFNYTNFINNILGNKVYGANFGQHYTGVIPNGMNGYVPPSQLQNVPVFNLTRATALMQQSGNYSTKVNFPIGVLAGDPTDYTGASMWAHDLNLMDPNITAFPTYVPSSSMAAYMAVNGNPLPIYLWGYAPDYPYPSDYVNPMYRMGGFYPAGDNWNVSQMISEGYSTEAAQFQNMQNLIQSAESTANVSLSLTDFALAEQIAVNLTLYVYTDQVNTITYFSPFIHGISYEENPMSGGATQLNYVYFTKT